MRFRSFALAGGLALNAGMFASCSPDHVSPIEPFRIEAIAPAEDGVVIWDPNDGPILCLRALGLSDSDAADVVWKQTGLAVDDGGWRGSGLALTAGGEGCGYGGVTFSISAVSSTARETATATVRMKRYICAGSPWTTP